MMLMWWDMKYFPAKQILRFTLFLFMYTRWECCPAICILFMLDHIQFCYWQSKFAYKTIIMNFPPRLNIYFTQFKNVTVRLWLWRCYTFLLWGKILSLRWMDECGCKMIFWHFIFEWHLHKRSSVLNWLTKIIRIAQWIYGEKDYVSLFR